MAATAPSTDQLLSDQPTGSLTVPRLRTGTSIAQLAYEAIRDAILAMDVYHPEADLRLDEKELASGSGRQPHARAQGACTARARGLGARSCPRRGVYIVRKNKAEITEMIRAWAALESMAARLLVRASDRRGDRQPAHALRHVRGRRAAAAPGRVLGGEPALPPAHHRARPLARDRRHGRRPARARARDSRPHDRRGRSRRAVDRRPHAHHRGARGPRRRAVRAPRPRARARPRGRRGPDDRHVGD